MYADLRIKAKGVVSVDGRGSQTECLGCKDPYLGLLAESVHVLAQAFVSLGIRFNLAGSFRSGLVEVYWHFKSNIQDEVE